MNKINKIPTSYLILILLTITISIQFSSIGIVEPTYSVLRYLAISLVCLLAVIKIKSNFTSIKYNDTLKFHLFLVVLTTIILFVLYAFNFDVTFEPIRDLFIAFIIISTSSSIRLTENQMLNLIVIYIIFTTLSALSIIYFYADGFQINQLYLPIPKNQIAPSYGIAFVSSLYLALNKKQDKKYIFLTTALLIFSSLLVLRGRAVIISSLFTILILIFYYLKSNKYKLFSIGLLIIISPLLGQYIYEALFLNYDVYDIESVSAGRASNYENAISFLIDNPLLGKMATPFNIKGTVHNYFLYNMTNYGVIISLLIFTIYLKYISITFRSIKVNNYKTIEIGPLIISILYFISLFEYTLPFAPGSTIMFPFILLGQFINRK